MKIFAYHDSRISQASDRITSQVDDSRASHVHDSRASQIHDFRASQVHDSRIRRESYILKQVKKFEYKGLVRPLLSRFCLETCETLETHYDFFISQLSRTCSMNFDNPTFRGCKGFTEFPNNILS
jgi:hypothetical protein